jgi:Enoyl-(Acyl carrier protein) reductase
VIDFGAGYRSRRVQPVVFVCASSCAVEEARDCGGLTARGPQDRPLRRDLWLDDLASDDAGPGCGASATRAAAEFADTEAHTALHRALTPDDTAAVVAMLARDEAEALTGQTLTADGGLVMR